MTGTVNKDNKKNHKKENKTHASNNDDKKTIDNSKNSLLYMILIIVGILAILGTSYFISKNINNTPLNDKQVVYNNFIFNKLDDNTWSVELSIKNAPYSIPFYYNPYEVENISMHQDILPAFKKFMNENPGGRVYVSLDPYEPSKLVIAGVEFTRLLGTKYDIFNFDVVPAFTRPHEAQNTSYPIITCKNANSKNMVIILGVGNITGIGYANNCIVLQAASLNDTVKVADAFSYRLLSIIR